MEANVFKSTVVHRELVYQFTDEEIKQMGEDLSDQVIEFSKLDIEKKEYNKLWNKKLKEMMNEIKRSSKIIDEGYVIRTVPCEIKFNEPRSGKKTVTRQDTGESWVEEMDYEDHNLFNQAEEEEDEEDVLPFYEVGDEEEEFNDDENEIPSWLTEEE